MPTQDEAEYESWQFERVRELAEQIAEECPWMWRISDGKGGYIFNEIRAAFARRGFDTDSEESSIEGGRRKSVPVKRRAEVFRRDGHKCLKCGASEYLTIDHILPISKGGGNEASNLQTLCLACNVQKGVQTISYLDM